jgi:uncharacterized protein YndB with AHSA1/START domain
MTTITAAGAVEAPAAAVFDFLADLRNHWALAPGRIEEVDASLDPANGGTVRMRGPLGIFRTATTQVVEAERPRVLRGRAAIGPRTRAEIEWLLEPADAAETTVRLSATVVATSGWDGLILRLGAGIWLRRLFAGVLGELAARGPQLPRDAAPAARHTQAAPV